MAMVGDSLPGLPGHVHVVVRVDGATGHAGLYQSVLCTVERPRSDDASLAHLRWRPGAHQRWLPVLDAVVAVRPDEHGGGSVLSLHGTYELLATGLDDDDPASRHRLAAGAIVAFLRSLGRRADTEPAAHSS